MCTANTSITCTASFCHDLTLVCTVNFTLSFSLRASGISIWREGSTFRSTDIHLSCKRIHRIIPDRASSRFNEADWSSAMNKNHTALHSCLQEYTSDQNSFPSASKSLKLSRHLPLGAYFFIHSNSLDPEHHFKHTQTFKEQWNNILSRRSSSLHKVCLLRGSSLLQPNRSLLFSA